MFEVQFRVDYADTDAMGVVYHANYLRWFERARVEWLRSRGVSYRKLEEDGYILPVKGAQLSYKKPLQFDDQASVFLTLSELGKASIDLHYQIYCNKQLMAEGQTSHVLCRRKVDPTTGRSNWSPVRIPEELKELWEPLKKKKL